MNAKQPMTMAWKYGGGVSPSSCRMRVQRASASGFSFRTCWSFASSAWSARKGSCFSSEAS